MIPQIFDFNRRALGVEPKDVPQLETAHAKFCVKAIREEAQELEDEHVVTPTWQGVLPAPIGTDLVWSDPQSEEARQQTVRSVDALVDAAYFAIGGLVRAGLSLEQALDCFAAIHECNMRKKLGVKANRGDMGVADAVKPTDWVGPEARIYEILFGQPRS